MGQETIDKDPIFIPGEEYKYDLFVDFIKVGPDLIKLGSASLNTKEIESINGKEAYRLNFVVRTSKVGDIIYKIRDKIDVWVDVETLTVVKQVKKLREGNRKRESTTIVKGNVATTNTFEVFRTTYNSTSQDVGDIGTLNDAFTGTPTDLVEAVNSKATKAFSIAVAVALG